MDHGPNKILVYPIQKYGDQCSGQSSIIILFLTEYFGLSLVSFEFIILHKGQRQPLRKL